MSGKCSILSAAGESLPGPQCPMAACPGLLRFARNTNPTPSRLTTPRIQNTSTYARTEAWRCTVRYRVGHRRCCIAQRRRPGPGTGRSNGSKHPACVKGIVLEGVPCQVVLMNLLPPDHNVVTADMPTLPPTLRIRFIIPEIWLLASLGMSL